MRYAATNVERYLRGHRERRQAIASMAVAGPQGHFVVITLAPFPGGRLVRWVLPVAWETQAYESEGPPRHRLGTRPHYAAMDAERSDALARHERLLARLEAGTFEAETGRDVLRPVVPAVGAAARAYERGDAPGALRALEEAIRCASRLDVTQRFFHLYQEAYLMRALILEAVAPDRGTEAYRDFIAVCAGLAERQPATWQAMAWARAAVERLTPYPCARRRPPQDPARAEEFDEER
jgi:hypothetical protein